MQIGYTVNVNLFRGALMVKIITDSASDFEPNELKELMIDCIPLSVNFGDEEYKDNVTISKDEFFDKLKNTTETVKTSQPSLHDIAEEFEAAEHSKDGGVAIFMSSKISGTANTAQMQKVCKLFFNLHTLFYKLVQGGNLEVHRVLLGHSSISILLLFNLILSQKCVLLGHSSISITQIYIHLAAQMQLVNNRFDSHLDTLT